MKIALIIGLLVALTSAVLAYMQRKELGEKRVEKDNRNREIVKIHDNTIAVNDETKKVHDTWFTTKRDAKDERLNAGKLKSETAEKQTELEAAQQAVMDVKTKREQMEAQIKAIVGPSGATPEQALARVEEVKNLLVEKTKELENETKELDIAKRAASDADQLAARLKEHQTLRDKAISLGGRSGTVAAVNNEWSFVVINLGKNQGVNLDSRLIVKRGGQLIGKLKLVQISANQTVADIDRKSLGNNQVQPGDEVIFDTPTNEFSGPDLLLPAAPMKAAVFSLFASLVAAVQVSCATDDSAKRKREMKEKMLNSGSEDTLPWNRPTRERDIATPFGLPMSH